VLGILPRSAALELLKTSHLALVLAQDQPLCVPAKLYESVGLGVPTLVIAETASAAAREARRVGAFSLEPHDAPGMIALLRELASGRIPTSVQPVAPISYASLAERMALMLRDRGIPVGGSAGMKPESVLRAV
jgi:hypothetical protein